MKASIDYLDRKKHAYNSIKTSNLILSLLLSCTFLNCSQSAQFTLEEFQCSSAYPVQLKNVYLTCNGESECSFGDTAQFTGTFYYTSYVNPNAYLNIDFKRSGSWNSIVRKEKVTLCDDDTQVQESAYENANNNGNRKLADDGGDDDYAAADDYVAADDGGDDNGNADDGNAAADDGDDFYAYENDDGGDDAVNYANDDYVAADDAGDDYSNAAVDDGAADDGDDFYTNAYTDDEYNAVDDADAAADDGAGDDYAAVADDGAGDGADDGVGDDYTEVADDGAGDDYAAAVDDGAGDDYGNAAADDGDDFYAYETDDAGGGDAVNYANDGYVAADDAGDDYGNSVADDGAADDGDDFYTNAYTDDENNAANYADDDDDAAADNASEDDAAVVDDGDDVDDFYAYNNDDAAENNAAADDYDDDYQQTYSQVDDDDNNNKNKQNDDRGDDMVDYYGMCYGDQSEHYIQLYFNITSSGLKDWFYTGFSLKAYISIEDEDGGWLGHCWATVQTKTTSSTQVKQWTINNPTAFDVAMYGGAALLGLAIAGVLIFIVKSNQQKELFRESLLYDTSYPQPDEIERARSFFAEWRRKRDMWTSVENNRSDLSSNASISVTSDEKKKNDAHIGRVV